MGKFDTEAKNYMSRNDRFADAFNYLIYGGRQVIKPDELVEMDVTELAIPFLDEKRAPIQKIRDILKSWKVMRDTNAIYVLFGIEVQGKVHYAMPLRNNLYDILNYADQIKECSKKNKSRKKAEGSLSSSAEFLSGFGRDDKLTPVITLTLYLGADRWDGPMSLREMFGEQSEEIMALLPDYKLNLISPENIAEEDFEKFSTELGKVLEYIKYSHDKEKLVNIVENDDSYRTVDRDTVSLINEATGSKLKITDKEEKINMCQAIEELKKEAKETGINTITILIGKLHSQNRDEDVWKASSDPEYLNQLLKEFGLYKE